MSLTDVRSSCWFHDLKSHMASTHNATGSMTQSATRSGSQSKSSSPRQSVKAARHHIPAMTIEMPAITEQTGESSRRIEDNCDGRKEDMTSTITISATARMAGQTVAPFLQKHIPEQYAPLGVQQKAASYPKKDTNTKYCY